MTERMASMEYEKLNMNETHHISDSFSEKRYVQMLRASKVNHGNILDCGIGSGEGGKVVKTNLPNCLLYGIDVVKSRASFQMEQYQDVRYGSILESGYEDDFFHLVLAGELIEHLSVDDIDTFILEVFRILKPGGVFCLTTPNPNDIKMRLRGGSVFGGSHISQHFIRETKIRLRLKSFRVVKCFGTGKMSLIIGRRFPKFLYGSYMLVSIKS